MAPVDRIYVYGDVHFYYYYCCLEMSLDCYCFINVCCPLPIPLCSHTPAP